MKKIITTSLFIIMGVQIVHAQSFSPDRPGIGNGSFITPQGMLGLEAGFQFSNTDFNEQYDIGQLLLRYGVNDKLELRTLLGSYTSVDQELIGGSRTYSGFQDISVGVKYNLLFGNDKPSISALAELNLPVGSTDFTNDKFVPSLGLLADHALHENLSISSNLKYSFGIGNVSDSWLFTFTPGFTISDNMDGYFGYVGMYYGDFEQHWVEVGLTYGLSSGVQLDVNFGYDTENEIAFLGAGFAKGF